MGSRRQRPRWGTGPAPTHRDVAVLAWVAEQYAVRADTLALLLGRLSPETPQTIHRWQYAPGQWTQLPRTGGLGLSLLALGAGGLVSGWLLRRSSDH